MTNGLCFSFSLLTTYSWREYELTVGCNDRDFPGAQDLGHVERTTREALDGGRGVSQDNK